MSVGDVFRWDKIRNPLEHSVEAGEKLYKGLNDLN